jgi:putative phosphoesterase
MPNSLTIGLIADTHMPGSMAELWPEALAFLASSDVILHAGDLHTLDIVDVLSEIAPTYVARGNGDVGIIDPRLQDQWQLDFMGFNIGMLHHCPSPARKSEAVIRKHLAKHFSAPPDVVIFGHTHLESVTCFEGLTLINPGSPTLPRNQSLQRGTLARLAITTEACRVTLYQIGADQVEPHPVITPVDIPSTSLGISV